jgi:predicted TIM-barrel fold metal-dependent hydrolase
LGFHAQTDELTWGKKSASWEVSPDRLFGTDYPAEDPASTLQELKRRNLSPNVLRALYRENAERLFPRFKSS